MLNISQNQLLDVWCDLEDARNGESSYGGNVAEIYAYQIANWSPGCDLSADLRRAFGAEASKSLWKVLVLFAEVRECRISIQRDDGWPRLGKWLRNWPNGHRFHVRVERRKAEEK